MPPQLVADLRIAVPSLEEGRMEEPERPRATAIDGFGGSTDAKAMS
jgi:hypothetical protein